MLLVILWNSLSVHQVGSLKHLVLDFSLAFFLGTEVCILLCNQIGSGSAGPSQNVGS